jgi:hypothetical protein
MKSQSCGAGARRLPPNRIGRRGWDVTERMGRAGPSIAGNIALTRLQADASATQDADLAHDVWEPVTTAPFDALRRGDALPTGLAAHEGDNYRA